MQAFVDKFRYNAKRASLVQSRIKAIERMADVQLVEADPEYIFRSAQPCCISCHLNVRWGLSNCGALTGYQPHCSNGLRDCTLSSLQSLHMLPAAGRHNPGKASLSSGQRDHKGAVSCLSALVSTSKQLQTVILAINWAPGVAGQGKGFTFICHWHSQCWFSREGV